MTDDKSLKLQKFELEMEEWSIAEDLVAVLLQYKNVTLFFSKDSASVATVIPVMDRIMSNLHYQTGKAGRKIETPDAMQSTVPLAHVL